MWLTVASRRNKTGDSPSKHGSLPRNLPREFGCWQDVQATNRGGGGRLDKIRFSSPRKLCRLHRGRGLIGFCASKQESAYLFENKIMEATKCFFAHSSKTWPMEIIQANICVRKVLQMWRKAVKNAQKKSAPFVDESGWETN